MLDVDVPVMLAKTISETATADVLFAQGVAESQ